MDANKNKIMTKPIAFVRFSAHSIMCLWGAHVIMSLKCGIIALLMMHDLQYQGISDLSAKTTEPTSDTLFVSSCIQFPHVKEAWIQSDGIWFHVLFFLFTHSCSRSDRCHWREKKKLKSELGHLNYVAEIQLLLSRKTDVNTHIYFHRFDWAALFFSPPQTGREAVDFLTFDLTNLVKWPLPAPCDRCRNLNSLWTSHCGNRPCDFITGRH